MTLVYKKSFYTIFVVTYGRPFSTILFCVVPYCQPGIYIFTMKITGKDERCIVC